MARHAPTGPVDWRTAQLGAPLPCVICRELALLRHPLTGKPTHKVCSDARQAEEGE
jgi:hypothetical protein